MNCPVCSKSMVEKDLGIKARVSVCGNGCKGIWFDYLALRQLDEKNEGAGEALQAALKAPRVSDNNRPALTCPKCGGVLHAHQYERAKEVNVDECYVCGGFFLDSGELSAIRDRFMSDAEQENYARQLINGIPACARENVTGKEEARAAAAKSLTGLLRKNYWQ